MNSQFTLDRKLVSVSQYILYLFLLAAIGCDKKEESDGSSVSNAPSESFISLAEISDPDAGVRKTRSKFDLLSKLSKSDEIKDGGYLQSSDNSDSNSDEEEEDEFSDVFNSIIIGGSESDEVIISASLDLRKIYEESFAKASNDGEGANFSPTSVAIHEASMVFFSKLQCEGADLSSFHGKPANDFTDHIDEACSGASTVRIISNMKGITDFKVSFASVATEQRIENYSVTMNEQGGACEYVGDSDGFYVDDGCIEMDKAVYVKYLTDGKEQEGHGKVEFTKFTSRSVKGEKKKSTPAAWYQEGSFDVQLDNWTGTVTFSGSEQVPNISFTDGSETVSGPLDTFSHLPTSSSPPPTSSSPYMEEDPQGVEEQGFMLSKQVSDKQKYLLKDFAKKMFQKTLGPLKKTK